MNPRPTLRDIAERAGVSTATVSLALRGHTRISAQVRERVRSIAAEVGYTPDPLISRLAAHGWNARRTRLRASVIAFVTGQELRKVRTWWSLLHGLREVAPTLGYRVEEFCVKDYRSPERLAEMLLSRGIEGVVLHQLQSEEFVERFPWQRFATVAAGLSIAMPPVHVVLSDYLFSLRDMWGRLQGAGYRRVGFVLMKEMAREDAVVRAGIIEHLSKESREASGLKAFVARFSAGESEEFVRWVKRRRLDAVVGLNDSFYWALTKRGFRVPEDIGFASLRLSPDETSKLTGWDARERAIAKSALEQLDLLMRAGERGLPESPYAVHVRPVWVAGSTFRSGPSCDAGEPSSAPER